MDAARSMALQRLRSIKKRLIQSMDRLTQGGSKRAKTDHQPEKPGGLRGGLRCSRLRPQKTRHAEDLKHQPSNSSPRLRAAFVLPMKRGAIRWKNTLRPIVSDNDRRTTTEAGSVEPAETDTAGRGTARDDCLAHGTPRRTRPVRSS